MNTVLLVEPRRLWYIKELLKQYQDVLGNMNYVFFCGKNSLDYWKKELKDLKYKIDLYSLPVDNMTANEYNNFMKRKDLWMYLKGNYVLVIQADTWINPDKNNKKNLNYFINLEKSYIGGNFCHVWNELKRENINYEYTNFNGGLSLRNRLDMIKVIDTFPPENTSSSSQRLETDAEDVYFTIGCIKLGLKVSDDYETISFALHDTEYKEGIFDHFFGFHQPSIRLFSYIPKQIKQTFFHLHRIAIFNGLACHYEMFGYIIEYCFLHNILLDIYTETYNNMGWLDFYLKAFPNVFRFLPLSSYQIDNIYMKVILITDDDILFDKEFSRENVICIDHYHQIRNKSIKIHIGTRYFKTRPELDWILPVYRQMDINTKKKIAKDNILFIGKSARDMINSEFVKNIKDKLNCIFIDRSINQMNTDKMIELVKESKYVFISDRNDHIDKSMSGSIPLALNFLCTLILPKEMNDNYKFKSVIEYDLDLNNINFKHNAKLVDKDLSFLLKHKLDVFDKILWN
jgi:hypothetical protein